ncbi:MAG: SufD family Fe-S cluster assembly protein, partial [Terriglobia bacterium]
MAETQETTETYFADFARLERETTPSAASWIHPLRKAAMERFGDTGFPTTHDEDWRFTNVAPIARGGFKMPKASGVLTAGQLANVVFDGVAARLVFVDGLFDAGLSSLKPSPNGAAGGVTLTPLATALDAPPKILQEHLAGHAETGHNPFVALNTAFLRDGAVIQIANDLALKEPLHVIHVRTGEAEGTVTHPRTLVVAGRGAQAMVIESYVSLAEEAYFTNAVTEVVVGENASVEHVKLQDESGLAFHVGTVQTRQERSSRFHSYSISLGGRLARHDVNAVLAG